MIVGTGHQDRPSCLRCGRPLRSASSVARGRGRWCQAKVRAAAETADLSGFKPEQAEKARELIELGAIVPTTRDGVYSAVSSDGTTVYLVDVVAQTCGCKAGGRGRSCYHLAGALILQASAPARKAA